MGTCWHPSITNVIDEPQDSSMAAIKVQRNRDIRVFAGVIINSIQSGIAATIVGLTEWLFPCFLQMENTGGASAHMNVRLRCAPLHAPWNRTVAVGLYRHRENRLKPGFLVFATLFMGRNCKNRRVGRTRGSFGRSIESAAEIRRCCRLSTVRNSRYTWESAVTCITVLAGLSKFANSR